MIFWKEGCFALKTAQKDFDADVDATSQKTGITSITDSLGARQRWARSHFLRTKIKLACQRKKMLRKV